MWVPSLTLDDQEMKVKAHIEGLKAELWVSVLEDELEAVIAEKERRQAGRRRIQKDGGTAGTEAAMLSDSSG